jgi:GNAT superfamily N-acetyltransferase
MGAVRGISREAADIKRMRVLPELQRRGFGNQILEALEKRAADLGYARCSSTPASTRCPPQAFYLKHRYREARRDDPTQPALIHFEKDL